ncbi:hypothetical protein D3Z51_12000 [Clostridiaceae bacterium]|nr:hypothetical protein [Clostridiaceae bacterium]RKI12611.1 hypothetical protein D7V81_11755 [bacterium 1XD21-70]
MYLHEDREQFLDAIRMTAGYTGMSEIVIEKDYYVTMILRLLSQKLPFVGVNENFKKLVEEVRTVRKCSNICPSAQDDADVAELLQTIIEQKIYKEDYQNLTEALLEEEVSYEMAIQAVEKIQASGIRVSFQLAFC